MFQTLRRHAKLGVALALIAGILGAVSFWSSSVPQPESPSIAQYNQVCETACAFTTCTPRDIASFSNRIHIRCFEVLSGGIQYFAMANSDPTVDHVLSMLNVAIANPGLKVFIEYATSQSDNPTGCQTRDCRGLLHVYLAR